MSHVMHGYFLNNTFHVNDEWVFTQVRELFLDFDNLTVSVESDPFDDQKYLHLNFDGYWLSVFYDYGQQVKDDFSLIENSITNVSSRIRIVFGPDINNSFNDITVIAYDYLMSLDDVLVFDVNQNEIVD